MPSPWHRLGHHAVLGASKPSDLALQVDGLSPDPEMLPSAFAPRLHPGLVEAAVRASQPSERTADAHYQFAVHEAKPGNPESAEIVEKELVE